MTKPIFENAVAGRSEAAHLVSVAAFDRPAPLILISLTRWTSASEGGGAVSEVKGVGNGELGVGEGGQSFYGPYSQLPIRYSLTYRSLTTERWDGPGEQGLRHPTAHPTNTNAEACAPASAGSTTVI